MYDSATLDELLPVPAEKRGLLATDTVSVPAAPVVNNLKVTLALVLIQAIWSLNAVYAKTGLRDMHVMVWYSLRLIFATPAFFALAYVRERESLFSSRSLKDWLWLGGLGMMGMVFNQLLFLSALSLTTATNAGMVSPAISVFSTAISALLCLEKLSLWKLGGISITVVGALIILEVENFELFGSSDILLGNLLAISSTVCFSLFIVLQKPLTARVTPTVLNFFVFAVGLVVIVPITLVGFWDEVVDVARTAPLNAYLSTLYSAFVAGVIGYSLNTWAIHQIAASTVALFYCLQALMIALFAWVLLGEQLTVRVALGGLLIMAGLVTVTWSLDRQRKKDARLALEQEAKLLLDAGNDDDSGGNDEKMAMMKMKAAMEKKSVDGTMLVLELSQDGAWAASPTSPPSAHQETRRKKSGEAEYGTFV